MANVEETLAKRMTEGDIPFAIVFATDADGSFIYKHAAGAAEDSVLLLASSTKLITSIAGLQVVEAASIPCPEPLDPAKVKDCFGGHGACCSMEDYLKIQRSILANDGRLLKPESVETMFTPLLSAESKAALQEFRASPLAAMLIGGNPANVRVDWGIAGLIFVEDDVGRRKKGTLNWGGAANTFWIIDREADLALSWGTQVLPPGDAKVKKVITQVELAVYEMRAKWKK